MVCAESLDEDLVEVEEYVRLSLDNVLLVLFVLGPVVLLLMLFAATRSCTLKFTIAGIEA